MTYLLSPKTKAKIIVTDNGKTVLVAVNFYIRFTGISLVDAIDYCEAQNYEYKIEIDSDDSDNQIP